MKIEQVAIIGAGPAGIAAAIQLKRSGVHPVIFEKHKSGGLLHNANLVENYPGFPDGISGANLVKLFERQIEKFALKIKPCEVTAVAYNEGLFEIEYVGGRLLSTILVIASGTKAIRPAGLQIPAGLRNRVYYEIDGLAGISGKIVAIVGGGDAAFDYALSFHEKNEVVILNRGNRTNCLDLLKERVNKSTNISYMRGVKLSAVERHKDRILIHCNNHNGTFRAPADFLVFAIGREPCLDFLTEPLKKKAVGLERKGLLYFAGDVINGSFRQTAIAVGDGIKAAMKIYARLKETR